MTRAVAGSGRGDGERFRSAGSANPTSVGRSSAAAPSSTPSVTSTPSERTYPGGGESGPDQVPSLFQSLWRSRWLILTAAVAGALVGLLLAYLQPPSYEATATMRLADPETTGVFESEPEVYTSRRQDLLTSRLVLERSAELLSPSLTADEIVSSITVEADPELLTLEVVARRGSARGAAETANAVAEAYQDISAERIHAQAQAVIAELQASQEALQARIEELEQQLVDITADSPDINEQLTEAPEPGSPAAVLTARLQNHVDQLIAVEARIQEVALNAEVVDSGVEMFEAATVPAAPVSPVPPLLAVLGAMLGIGVAAAFAYWRAGAASRVWTSADAARVLGAPLLGRVPRVRASRPASLPADLDRSVPVVEAYQFILNSIEYELTRIDGSSILVTSAGPAQSKTVTCVHLALTAARPAERDVVLIDGDLRTRYLSRLFDGLDKPGLTDLAGEQTTIEDAMVRRAITLDVDAWILPAGDGGHDPSLLRAPDFHDAMLRLRRSADLTIVDSAPILAVADTSVLASHVDGVVLIVNERTAMADLHRVKERMSFVSTPLLGYIYVGDRSGEFDTYGYPGPGEGAHQGPLRDRIASRWRAWRG